LTEPLRVQQGSNGPCVAVVGMHRSGTSATAGMLIAMGLDGPRGEDLVVATESNQRGHWESEAVNVINADVLSSIGASTYAPAVPGQGWEHAGSLDELRRQARNWYGDTSLGRPVVLKDPRLCLTLPFWRTVEAPVAAIFVLRDPLQVAASLQARDELTILLGLALFDRYVRSAACVLEGLPTLVVEYDSLLSDPGKSWDAVVDFLVRAGVEVRRDVPGSARGQLDPRLRHQHGGLSGYEAVAGAETELLSALVAQSGEHACWQPPDLPAEPPWVNDVIQMQLELTELAQKRHQLYWTSRSRPVRMMNALWRFTGRGPKPLSGQDESVEWSRRSGLQH
jgi:hypothetical protein